MQQHRMLQHTFAQEEAMVDALHRRQPKLLSAKNSSVSLLVKLLLQHART
jgi:hypothetical protein